MTPQVIQWNCAVCKEVVTAEHDIIAKQMATDELQARGKAFTGLAEGFKGKGPEGFKCFSATRGGYDNAAMCSQCLEWIERPLVVNWCPECGAPVHADCTDHHYIRTHGKRFDEGKPKNNNDQGVPIEYILQCKL